MNPSYWSRFASVHHGLHVESSTLVTRDSSTTHLYEAGPARAPCIVLVSPAESPFLLISPLFAELSKDFRVIAWDSPGAPFMELNPNETPPTIERMAENLLDIVSARALHRPHIVTWCAGGLIMLWAEALSAGQFGSASLVAPPGVVSRSSEKTALQTYFLPLVLQLASRATGDLARLRKKLREIPKAQPVTDPVDQAILDLTGLNFRSDEAMDRYAWLIQDMSQRLPLEPTSRTPRSYADVLDELCTRTPVALLHSRDDNFADFRCSIDVAERNENVRLVVYPRGGHFVQFKQPAPLAADIRTFILNLGSET